MAEALVASTRLRGSRMAARSSILRNPLNVLAIGLIAGFAFCAVFAPLLAPYDPLTQALASRLEPPSPAHVLGTDQLGRDIASRLLYGARISLFIGVVVVASAGTADHPVAEEAALVAEALGNRVERVYDCGVAGLHRLLDRYDLLADASAIVAVAGMEGALPSVIGGLVDRPVIAVPTSVGYGVSFGGFAALLAMLGSCAPGVSVVNIDNGYGAAHQASQINHLVAKIR